MDCILKISVFVVDVERCIVWCEGLYVGVIIKENAGEVGVWVEVTEGRLGVCWLVAGGGGLHQIFCSQIQHAIKNGPNGI